MINLSFRPKRNVVERSGEIFVIRNHSNDCVKKGFLDKLEMTMAKNLKDF